MTARAPGGADPAAAAFDGPLIVAPHLRVLALRTPTLPPATRTNTSMVGQGRFWIVDAATPHSAERARLAAAIDARLAGGETLVASVLTHHHRDHVGAADWVRETFGVPVLAHRDTARLARGRVRVDETLAEGDELDGGDGPPWHVLHTPGHASDHLCLWEPEHRLAVVGDMVAGEGTIVVDPPDGHMGTYLAQLGRLRELAARRVVPAHGPVLDDPRAIFSHYISHRLAREAKVLGALSPDAQPLGEITRRAYPEVPPMVLPLAARSALAHLIKLVEEGRAAEGPGGHYRAA